MHGQSVPDKGPWVGAQAPGFCTKPRGSRFTNAITHSSKTASEEAEEAGRDCSVVDFPTIEKRVSPSPGGESHS